jgi:crotonobetainyl-CoA:carnitine CoA-transferase CaiB-like acyl-CoA transferase
MSSGPLDGVRVVELASDHAAFAGKLLGDLGAEVIVVEPPGGHRSRRYEPFVDDVAGPERSLWWWYYNTSKLGVVLQLDDDADAATFRRLVATADIVLEGEPPGRLAARGLAAVDLRPGHEQLVWVSVTPFGRDNPRGNEEFTDLTVLAGGGPVWMCGYDDHTLPPVRGGGNQGFHTVSVWAVIGTLTALLARDMSGAGQLVDVSMHAAANVTTEAGTYEWLVARRTVQRQTGRHAAVTPTMASLVESGDGRWSHTGFPPRTPEEFAALLRWLDELDLRNEFEDTPLLELGIDHSEIRAVDIGTDPVATEVFRAARDGLSFVASHLTVQEFFVGAQRHGLACGAVYAPEEALENEHFVARGFPAVVHHEELDRDVVYPGAPFPMPASPMRVTRAPRVGEHNHLLEEL